MENMLDRIITHKRQEVENAKITLPQTEIEAQAKIASAPRGFVNAILKAHRYGDPALIAEIKKASPSKGLIREDFDPAQLATAYEAGGATCISVLTDVSFFQGHPVFLKEVRTAASLPVLRKDFMIDGYQVVEARAWGADCILVIMAAVDDEMAQTLTDTAKSWGMDVLIEVHNRQELERALKLNSVLIGINNRNLQTFDIKLEVTEGLAPLIPHDRIVVSESGIFKNEDLSRLAQVGVKTYLVGECLMRQDDVELATKKLLGREVEASSSAEDVAAGETEDPQPAGVAAVKGDDAASNITADPGENIDSSKMTDDFQAAVQELGAMIGVAGGEKSETGKSGDGADRKKDAGITNEEATASAKLSHVNDAGEAHMVDVSGKTPTRRVAVAEGLVTMKAETLAKIQQNTMKKGDVLATARIAGIMAAKKTPELIPLCHPLAITSVEVEFAPGSQTGVGTDTGIKVTATVTVDGKTGVEMEALTAVSVACLTIYDMGKAIDKGMRFEGIRLLEKSGGKSGDYRAIDAAE